jgi:hypothetical protein
MQWPDASNDERDYRAAQRGRSDVASRDNGKETFSLPDIEQQADPGPEGCVEQHVVDLAPDHQR